MLRRLLLLFAVTAVVGACAPAGPSPSAGRSSGSGPGEVAGRAASTETDQEGTLTQDRLDAAATARANGTFGSAVKIASNPASGWTGEQLLNPTTDDWEPAVATDPHAPYIYMLTTRYGTDKTCASHCPSPYLPLTVSADDGATWSAQVPLCICRGSGAQYDPTIQVVPDTGAVYSAFLNADRAGGFSTVFIKSSDHGRTWTDPVHVYGKVSWTDKPEIVSSASGKDVYVSWNGPQGGDLYVGVSHDYGATWTHQKLTNSKRYYFAYDGTVLPDGTVVFSESSLLYSGVGNSAGNLVWHHAIISRNNGKTWTNVVVDKVAGGEPCVADGCGSDFYLGQTSVTSDPRGHLIFAYEGASTDLGPQRVYVRSSRDQGRTWGARTALSANGENATGPRLASGGKGNARIWYMQTSNGDNPDAWNVWYRSSNNGGRSWSTPVRLSDATSGPGYVTASGFDEIYGDYGEIGVTDTGKTIAVWGEAFSYVGPGGTWFAIQR
jgi:BNR repeat-like domain